jgi:predicted deacetylase
MTASRRTIAVALHDIEPATFERCALIRDWLDDHGVGRVTLLVIPARDLHPLAERSPEMVSWLLEHERSGDAIAQHGFQHLRSGRPRGPYQALRGVDRETEFLGLDEQETRSAVDAGRRVLKLAGIEPRGFVAPGYAYTPALRRTLGERFHWWTALLGLHRAHPARPQLAAESRPVTPAGAAESRPIKPARAAESRPRRERLAPPIALSSSGRLRHALSPALLRAGALVSGATLRLDLHPSDLDHPNHMLALEWVLQRSAGTREAVTYEQLATGGSRPSAPPRTAAGLRYPPEKSDGLSGFTSERPA